MLNERKLKYEHDNQRSLVCLLSVLSCDTVIGATLERIRERAHQLAGARGGKLYSASGRDIPINHTHTHTHTHTHSSPKDHGDRLERQWTCFHLRRVGRMINDTGLLCRAWHGPCLVLSRLLSIAAAPSIACLARCYWDLGGSCLAQERFNTTGVFATCPTTGSLHNTLKILKTFCWAFWFTCVHGGPRKPYGGSDGTMG